MIDIQSRAVGFPLMSVKVLLSTKSAKTLYRMRTNMKGSASSTPKRMCFSPLGMADKEVNVSRARTTTSAKTTRKMMIPASVNFLPSDRLEASEESRRVPPMMERMRARMLGR